MKLCGELIGAMFVRDPDQLDTAAQRLQAFAIVRFQMPRSEGDLAQLQDAIYALSGSASRSLRRCAVNRSSSFRRVWPDLRGLQ